MATTTIRDVARHAGVGVGTVSRVLNDNPLVREVTREKVLTAIQELNYTPSPIARRLSLGKTHTVAVIAPFITEPSVVERLRGIESVLAETEYDLLLYNVENITRRDSCFHSVPRPERIDGLLLITLPPAGEFAGGILDSDVPTVLLGVPNPDFNRVVVDDVSGGYWATKHLIDLGHRRIGYISDFLENPFNFVASLNRFEGYYHALAEADITFRPEYHRQGEHGRRPAREMARELLTLDDPPTAIFAASDMQAVGALEAARELDIRIPDDFSVIGYDNIEIAEIVNLTTVNQPLYDSGVESTDLLMEEIDHPSTTIRESLLPTELVVRETTGPAPK
jgi:DNA-binding LacI/PurR family transcriptional regulator